MTSNISTENSQRRQLNWIDAAAIFVGIIIGSGIFVAPAQVIAATGSMGLAISFWAVGGWIAACGAFCYAECGARLPRDGGFFNAFRVAFGGGPAFVGGWTVALVIYPAAHAAIAYIFAGYLTELLPAVSGHETAMAVMAVAVVTVLNIAGLRSGPNAQRIMTALKIIALALLCSAALLGGQKTDPDTGIPADFTMGLSTAFAALIVVLWTYDGWADITMIAGELKDPARDLGRAVWVGCSVLILVYLLVQFSISSLLSFDQASTSDRVFADAVSVGFGANAAKLVASLIVLCALGSLNGSVLVCSRLIQTMSADGFFFSALGKLDGRGVPLRAVIMIAVATAAYVVTASFDFLLGLFSVVIWIIYALSAIALLILRRRRVGEPVRFHAPLGVVPPVTVIMASMIMTAGTIMDAPLRALIGAGMLVLIVIIYRMWRPYLPDSNPISGGQDVPSG
ncbi:MAG: amino acid permease [Phycisphaerae bacterium]|nr:amino acid permease [Phycisphaerae bacterium]